MTTELVKQTKVLPLDMLLSHTCTCTSMCESHHTCVGRVTLSLL